MEGPEIKVFCDGLALCGFAGPVSLKLFKMVPAKPLRRKEFHIEDGLSEPTRLGAVSGAHLLRLSLRPIIRFSTSGILAPSFYMTEFWIKLRTTLEMIKFEHTLFALPFAFLGAILAAEGLPTWPQILWITVAMFGARSAAMTFNRIIDVDFDSANPRTANRELPSGKLSMGFAWAFLFVSVGIFVLAAYSLNWLTFALSPVALLSVLGYSYAKRFTAFSHLVLGWALAISPTAAWIAVRGTIDSEIPLLISLVVLMWTAGFDVMYACQDYEFDKKVGLRSIPARFGIKNSLRIARLFHVQAFIALVLLYLATGLSWPALAGVLLVGGLLIYQHTLVSAKNLSRMNAAFFTTNAIVSVILFISFSVAVFIAK